MTDPIDIFLAKAQESLAGAESEFVNGRYNNCANRSYYACFQSAVSALLQAGIRPPGGATKWAHAFVQAQFAGELIVRRKRFSAELRDALPRALNLREVADYKTDTVTAVQAQRAIRRSRDLLDAITLPRGGGSR